MNIHNYTATAIAVNREPIPTQGRYLSRLLRNQHARDFIAADLWTGKRTLVRPSLVRAALLTGSNPTSVLWAARREELRAEIVGGVTPLVPKKTARNGNGRAVLVPTTDIANSELLVIGRIVGSERLLNVAAAVEAAE